MCLSGLFVAIELKSSGGKLSELQKYNMNLIALSGGIALVISPENLEEAMAFLTKVANESHGSSRIQELI